MWDKRQNAKVLRWTEGRTDRVNYIYSWNINSYVRIPFNLSYDGGGGAQSVPPTFICENNKKSNKIMHFVEIVFFEW